MCHRGRRTLRMRLSPCLTHSLVLPASLKTTLPFLLPPLRHPSPLRLRRHHLLQLKMEGPPPQHLLRLQHRAPHRTSMARRRYLLCWEALWRRPSLLLSFSKRIVCTDFVDWFEVKDIERNERPQSLPSSQAYSPLSEVIQKWGKLFDLLIDSFVSSLCPFDCEWSFQSSCISGSERDRGGLVTLLSRLVGGEEETVIPILGGVFRFERFEEFLVLLKRHA